MDKSSPKEFGMTIKAVYKIVVKGKLNVDWAEWFNGSNIQIETDQQGNPVTILTCSIKDQSELFGIMNRLNGLNLPLLEVTSIGLENR
jgi:hypothetical protein